MTCSVSHLERAAIEREAGREQSSRRERGAARQRLRTRCREPRGAATASRRRHGSGGRSVAAPGHRPRQQLGGVAGMSRVDPAGEVREVAGAGERADLAPQDEHGQPAPRCEQRCAALPDSEIGSESSPQSRRTTDLR